MKYHAVDLKMGQTIEDFAFELTERIQNGEIKVIYRILSRKTKNSIGEYQKFSDIPEDIYDENIDEMFRIEPQDLELVYTNQP